MSGAGTKFVSESVDLVGRVQNLICMGLCLSGLAGRQTKDFKPLGSKVQSAESTFYRTYLIYWTGIANIKLTIVPNNISLDPKEYQALVDFCASAAGPLWPREDRSSLSDMTLLWNLFVVPVAFVVSSNFSFCAFLIEPFVRVLHQ